MTFDPRGLHAEPWTLVDRKLTNTTSVRVASDILLLANSDWSTEPIVDFTNPAVRDLLTRHRVTTMLSTSNVPETQREEFLNRLLHINGAQLQIEAVAGQVLELLSDAGIESRVLKGLASGELDYPNRALRQGGDVDLAIRQFDFDHAVALLTRAGYQEKARTEGDFLLKGTTLVSPNNVEVDLHTRLFQRSPQSDVLFVDGEPLRDLRSSALPANLRLVHAAGHFILAPPNNRRLTGLVDIARIQRHPSFDLAEARSYASRLGVESMVGSALRLEAQLSHRPDVVEALTQWKQPGWLDRNTRLVPERRYALDHLARFGSVLPSQRLRYVRTWLLPSRRHRRIFVTSVEKRLRTYRLDITKRLSRGQ